MGKLKSCVLNMYSLPYVDSVSITLKNGVSGLESKPEEHARMHENVREKLVTEQPQVLHGWLAWREEPRR